MTTCCEESMCTRTLSTTISFRPGAAIGRFYSGLLGRARRAYWPIRRRGVGRAARPGRRRRARRPWGRAGQAATRRSRRWPTCGLSIKCDLVETASRREDERRRLAGLAGVDVHAADVIELRAVGHELLDVGAVILVEDEHALVGRVPDVQPALLVAQAGAGELLVVVARPDILAVGRIAQRVAGHPPAVEVAQHV